MSCLHLINDVGKLCTYWATCVWVRIHSANAEWMYFWVKANLVPTLTILCCDPSAFSTLVSAQHVRVE